MLCRAHGAPACVHRLAMCGCGKLTRASPLAGCYEPRTKPHRATPWCVGDARALRTRAVLSRRWPAQVIHSRESDANGPVLRLSYGGTDQPTAQPSQLPTLAPSGLDDNSVSGALANVSITTTGVAVIAALGGTLLLCVAVVLVRRRRRSVRQRKRLDASRRSLELPSFVSMEGMEGSPAAEGRSGAIGAGHGHAYAQHSGVDASSSMPAATVGLDSSGPGAQTWESLPSTALGTADLTDIFTSFDIAYGDEFTTGVTVQGGAGGGVSN
jgi:hypothetical protein